MPWTKTTRLQHRREGLRYASDALDAEWRVIAPLLPGRRRVGRPRTVDLREILNAIFYVLMTGCQWRALPKDFPPRSTVQGYFYHWRDLRLWVRINRALVALERQRVGRSEHPSAGVIDSQSVKTTESGGACEASIRPSASRDGKRHHRHTTPMAFSSEACPSTPAAVQDNHCAASPCCDPPGGRACLVCADIFADQGLSRAEAARSEIGEAGRMDP